MNIFFVIEWGALPAKVAHFFLPKNIPNTDSSRYMKKNFKT